MPRYFFHLRDGADVLLDPEGAELARDAVVAVALRSARDCMANDIKEGLLDLDQRIDVEDETGAVVHSVEFVEAVKLTLPSRRPIPLRPLDEDR